MNAIEVQNVERGFKGGGSYYVTERLTLEREIGRCGNIHMIGRRKVQRGSEREETLTQLRDRESKEV